MKSNESLKKGSPKVMLYFLLVFTLLGVPIWWETTSITSVTLKSGLLDVWEKDFEVQMQFNILCDENLLDRVDDSLREEINRELSDLLPKPRGSLSLASRIGVSYLNSCDETIKHKHNEKNLQSSNSYDISFKGTEDSSTLVKRKSVYQIEFTGGRSVAVNFVGHDVPTDILTNIVTSILHTLANGVFEAQRITNHIDKDIIVSLFVFFDDDSLLGTNAENIMSTLNERLIEEFVPFLSHLKDAKLYEKVKLEVVPVPIPAQSRTKYRAVLVDGIPSENPDLFAGLLALNRKIGQDFNFGVYLCSQSDCDSNTYLDEDWGGIIVIVPEESGDFEMLHTHITNVMKYQLKRMLGLSVPYEMRFTSREISVAHAANTMGFVDLSEWETDLLMRKRISALLEDTEYSTRAIHEGRNLNVEVTEEVAANWVKSLKEAEAVRKFLAEGDMEKALSACHNMKGYADAAYYTNTYMKLYLRPDFLLAIYLPIVFPIFTAIVFPYFKRLRSYLMF